MSGSMRIVGEESQRRLGAALADALGGEGCVIHLEGELGTGKTTLVRGLLRRLGHQGSVRSPTYTLVEPYSLARGEVFHLDLYRLADPDELEFLGLRDLLEPDALLLVEWPERGRGVLPVADLTICIEHDKDARQVGLSPGSLRGQGVCARLAYQG